MRAWAVCSSTRRCSASAICYCAAQRSASACSSFLHSPPQRSRGTSDKEQRTQRATKDTEGVNAPARRPGALSGRPNSKAAARRARGHRLDRRRSTGESPWLRAKAAGPGTVLTPGTCWSATIRWTTSPADTARAGWRGAAAAGPRSPRSRTRTRRLLLLDVDERPLVVVRTAVVDANRLVLAFAGNAADAADGAGAWRSERRRGPTSTHALRRARRVVGRR